MAKMIGVGTKGVGQVYDGPQFKRWDSWQPNEELEGKYVGRSEKPDKYGKFGFIIEDATGTQTMLNSTGLLEKKFVHIEEGSDVLVRYKGKNKIAKGKWEGSMAHNIEVFVAGVEASGEDDDDI